MTNDEPQVGRNLSDDDHWMVDPYVKDHPYKIVVTTLSAYLYGAISDNVVNDRSSGLRQCFWGAGSDLVDILKCVHVMADSPVLLQEAEQEHCSMSPCQVTYSLWEGLALSHAYMETCVHVYT